MRKTLGIFAVVLTVSGAIGVLAHSLPASESFEGASAWIRQEAGKFQEKWSEQKTTRENRTELKNLPVNVPLKDFLLLDPITVFAMKHRKGSPPAPIIEAKAEDIIAGKYNVQIGVRVTGKVQNAHRFDGDGDWTFDFGDLHLEITPYWQKEFEKRHIPLPQNGQTVRAMGWTYYDYFHKTDDDKGEEEGDEEFSGPGILRKTLWEVHPVQDVEVLSR